jgi:hypothetical protein
VSRGLLAEVRWARKQLPGSHRRLLEELRVQETAIDAWPSGVLDLYRSVRETLPHERDISGAAAVWLDGLRTVAFNARFFESATAGLSDEWRRTLVAGIVWHEYGHALSLVRSTADQRRDGPRLYELLPPGLKGQIDYPQSYRAREVFDEVVAGVYALMISRIRTEGYGFPDFLHSDITNAFQDVIPWPPTP